MNPAQIHLGLNHLPSVLVLVGVACLVAGFLKKAEHLKNTATSLFIVAALITVPVYLSGEPTEDLIEHLPGIAGPTIHEHEAAAKWGLIFCSLLGGLSLGVRILESKKKTVPKFLWFLILFLGVMNLSIFLRTNHLGGLIRHQELQ